MSKNYKVINEYNVVEKSKSLIQLDQYAEFGEAQYILLDIYMSQINPREDKVKIAKFPKTDYEVYKNIQRVKPSSLDKDLQKLMIPVKLPDPTDPNSFRIKPLFAECSCQIEDDGQYWITMICDEEMSDYFFDITKIGYIKYRLGMMRNLSLPARLLYNELHQYKYVKPYVMTLDKIRKVMKMDTKFYKENQNAFMREMRKHINEINEITNLLVSFTKQTNGKHIITSIEFITNIDENKIDEDLAMYIASLMDISYDQAEPITKAAQASKLTDEDIEKRINHILNKADVKNKIGYAIRIMDNNLWDKIEQAETKKENDSITDDVNENSEKKESEEHSKLSENGRQYSFGVDENGRLVKNYE